MFEYVMITAAGQGARLDPLTQYLPKALVKVNGVSLIKGLLNQVTPAIPSVSITIGYKGDLLASSLAGEVSALYNTSGRGNAWWIFNTPLKFIDAPVLVLACDIIVDMDLDFISGQYQLKNEAPCMMVPIPPVKGVEGDYIAGTNGKVQSFSRTNYTTMLSAGIYVVNPYKVNLMMNPKQHIEEVWNTLILSQDLAYSDVYSKYWATVNTLEQLHQCQYSPEIFKH